MGFSLSQFFNFETVPSLVNGRPLFDSRSNHIYSPHGSETDGAESEGEAIFAISLSFPNPIFIALAARRLRWTPVNLREDKLEPVIASVDTYSSISRKNVISDTAMVALETPSMVVGSTGKGVQESVAISDVDSSWKFKEPLGH